MQASTQNGISKISHSIAYEYWRTHGRNNAATAEHVERTPALVAKWRAEESWDVHADAADSETAAAIATAADLARLTAEKAIQQALDNALFLQCEITINKQKGVDVDGMDVQAASGALRAAIAAADTVYNWSKITLDARVQQVPAPSDGTAAEVLAILQAQGVTVLEAQA